MTIQNKGAEWLRRAAEQDEPDAQVALAEYALRGTPDAESVKRAKIWLERAAASGSRDGKLYLAALLAAAPSSDVRDPLRERLAHYKARQPWYGDLLGL